MEAVQLVGPLILFILMGVVGLELVPADFRRVLAAPRAVIGGTLAQVILLPLMTWGVVWITGVPPVFGAGAILVALAPGAGMSNILAVIAGANAALSVTLTAVASVVTVLALPTIASVGIRFFLSDGIDVEVPVAPLIAQLAVALLLPLTLGMWVRWRFREFALRNRTRLQRAAMLLIVIILAAAVALDGGASVAAFEDPVRVLVAAGLWTLAAMSIGWLVAAALGLPDDDRFTFLIEFGARNVAVSAIVALSGLGRLDLTLFSAAYMAIGYTMVWAVVFWRRWRHIRMRIAAQAA